MRTSVNLNDFSKIDADYLLDELLAISRLLADWDLPADFSESVKLRAQYYIHQVRNEENAKTGINALLLEYDLSSKEGVVLLKFKEF